MRRATNPTLRFLGSVLITSGLLLLIDAGATLVWQEPVTALVARMEQSKLDERLERIERETRVGRPGGAGRIGSSELRRLARAYRRRVEPGEPFGRIRMPTLGRSYVVIEGTEPPQLRRGPGHYPGTRLPGEGGTVAVAGHRTTYLAPFRPLDELDPGERIELEMPYARLVYRVKRRRIVRPDEVSVVRDIGSERLVLTACHPLYSASRRIVVDAALEAAFEPPTPP